MPDTQADSLRRGAGDALSELRELRQQVETLMRDRVPPMISDAAERVTSAAKQAGGFVQEEAEAVATRVRNRPLTWIVGAAIGGYLLGRITR
jgi:ElaB/YqjD/DUF883 family membrane-anchored ribosome-binding protein